MALKYVYGVGEWNLKDMSKRTSAKSQPISNRFSSGVLYERNIELSYNCFVSQFKIGTDMTHLENMMAVSSCITSSVGLKDL